MTATNPPVTSVPSSDHLGSGSSSGFPPGGPVETIDLPPTTFEQAVEARQVAAVVEVVAVDPSITWNTESGELGSRSEWEDAYRANGAIERGWQQLTFRLLEPIKGDLGLEAGEAFDVVYDYVTDPSFDMLDRSFVDSTGVALLDERDPVVFRDGSEVEMLFLSPHSRFALGGGPAVCLYCIWAGSWRDAGGLDQPVPDERSAEVVASLEEIIDRARDPGRPLEEHLGYAELDLSDH